MTLIATPKAINANSYATVIEADTYHSGRLFNTEWTAATTANKETSLIMATRLINLNKFTGIKTTSTQALKYPRYGIYDDDGNSIDSDTNPQALIDAVSEYAFLLIIKDLTRESSDKGIKKLKVGPIDIEINASDRSKPIPPSVMSMIKQWLLNYNTISVARG